MRNHFRMNKLQIRGSLPAPAGSRAAEKTFCLYQGQQKIGPYRPSKVVVTNITKLVK